MASDFPIVDRNRYISNASKTLLELAMPATWQIVPTGGDADFGLDFMVQLAVEGGVRHTFHIQLKGTESPDFIGNGTAISYPLKRLTLNLYANMTSDVMIAIATVVLDEYNKIDTSASKIYWQWISRELTTRRGSSFELDLSQGKTTNIHIPCNQVLHSRLDVESHLQELRDIVSAGISLEEILRRTSPVGSTYRQPALSRLVDIIQHRPQDFSAWFHSDAESLPKTLPSIAHEIRTLIRAGNTVQAEAALRKISIEGFGPAASQKAAYLSMQGKVLMQHCKHTEALRLFEAAYAVDAAEDNLLPLTEIRFLLAFDKNDINEIYSIRESLREAASDEALALSVRINVSLKDFAGAEYCLQRISESKQLIPRLVLLSAQQKWQEVVSSAMAAELDVSLSIADLTNAQLVAARAAWCGATENVVVQGKPDELPLSGAVGTKLELACEAWQLSVKCLKGLQTLGWGPNIELLAPVVCGVAGLLGHQRAAMELIGDAARNRQEYQELQLNLELLAISAGEPEIALAANLRQPDSRDVLTRRTSLFFQLHRFKECQTTALALARSSEAPSTKTPLAFAVGYAAAHRIGYLLEAGELHQRLSSHAEWGEYLYFAEFAKLGSVLPSSEESLTVLREGLIKYPSSWLLASNLYSNIFINNAGPAAEAIELAKLLRKNALLSLDDSLRLVAAHTTLKNWDQAATETAIALERFGTSEQLLAMGAVAEEMLGRTGVALSMLEKALTAGTDRISVVHNYMGLALRLGRIDAVRTALDQLLGLITDRTERLELMRLSALVYVQQGRPEDAIASAEGVGYLVDQSDEKEEGTYINLVMTATLNGDFTNNNFWKTFSQRVDAFCAKWPHSKWFRRVTMPQGDLNGLDDLHRLLDPIVGDSRARLREFEQRERLARRGDFPIPFTLRPGFVLHYIGDPFTLWEVAMRSRPDDLQFHLSITGQGNEPRSPCAARDTPILDLTALLVLDSLDLFDKLFTVFKRVAIARLTVGFVSQHANGLLARGSSMIKAKSILAKINCRLDHIDQPSHSERQSNTVLSAMDVIREYAHLAKQGKWLAYSDDAIFRAMAHAENQATQFFTTVDLLNLLDSDAELTAQQIALKLARLAEWNVGINVANRYLIASLSGAVPDASRSDASHRADAFQKHGLFTTLSRAIWHPAKSANDLVAHMAYLLQSMLQSPDSDVDSVAAVLACWYIRVRMFQQTEGFAWKLICYPVLLTLKSTQDENCRRLIGVLQRAVAVSVGEQVMSTEIESEVAGELGTVLASIAKREKAIGGELLRKLLLAMPLGTANGDRCIEGYINGMKISTSSKSTE